MTPIVNKTTVDSQLVGSGSTGRGKIRNKKLFETTNKSVYFDYECAIHANIYVFGSFFSVHTMHVR